LPHYLVCVLAETQIDVSLVTSPSYTSHVVSVLTDDLISKQTALDKLQSAVLRAEGSSQLRLWRVQEAEKRNRVLAADLAQLRKLLHEEKSSSKVIHSTFFFIFVGTVLCQFCTMSWLMPFGSYMLLCWR